MKLKYIAALLLAVFLLGSCGSSRKYGKNPKRHKSMDSCGVNVRY
jgi:hypothetical protein